MIRNVFFTIFNVFEEKTMIRIIFVRTFDFSEEILIRNVFLMSFGDFNIKQGFLK